MRTDHVKFSWGLVFDLPIEMELYIKEECKSCRLLREQKFHKCLQNITNNEEESRKLRKKFCRANIESRWLF